VGGGGMAARGAGGAVDDAGRRVPHWSTVEPIAAKRWTDRAWNG